MLSWLSRSLVAEGVTICFDSMVLGLEELQATLKCLHGNLDGLNMQFLTCETGVALRSDRAHDPKHAQ